MIIIEDHRPAVEMCELLMMSALLALVAPPPDATPVPPATEVLRPATAWKVDYAKEECRLLRSFGTGDKAVTIRLARGSGLQSFDFVVAGAAIPKLGRNVVIVFRLVQQSSEATYSGYSMSVPNRPERFIRWYDGAPELLNAITNDQQVELRADGRFSIAMEWSDARAALDALTTCHDNLMAGWGVDIARLHSVKQQPQPLGNPARWATNDDYPKDAAEEALEGTVVFLLHLSAAGAVEDCRVLVSSKIAALDEKTCQLMRERPRFTPALDAEGKAVPSLYVNRVRWQLPR